MPDLFESTVVALKLWFVQRLMPIRLRNICGGLFSTDPKVRKASPGLRFGWGGVSAL